MAAAVPNPPQGLFTVRDALVLCCGVDDQVMFQGQTAATRLAEGLFSNNFMKCMDKSLKDLKEDFESYSSLSPGTNQVDPHNQNNIKAFIQWTRDQIRTGTDPSMSPFPVVFAAQLERQLTTHGLYVKQSKDAADTLKPKMLKNDVKWTDWKPTLVNFLYQIPGRDGVPLSYIVRDHDAPDRTTIRPNFLEMYVHNAPLYGEAYNLDTIRVANVIQSLIIGNPKRKPRSKL
jgi:hypothetical protein